MIPRWLAPAATPLTLGGAAAALRALGSPKAAQEALSAALCARFGAERAVLTDSGTSALRLAIDTLCPPGRPVALPAFGCYDLITALQGAARRAVLYDVDPATLSPDLESFEAMLTQGPGAIVVASTFGYTPDMDAITERINSLNIPLIEDIAQAGGAAWNGRSLGRFGDAAVLSFGRGKGLGGGGGGALVLHKSAASHTTMRCALPPASTLRDAKGVIALGVQQALSHPLLFAIPSAIPQLALGETQYHPPHLPHAIGSAQAALATHGLERVDVDRASRAAMAARVTRALFTSRSVTNITVPSAADPGWLRVGALMQANLALRLRPLGVRRSYPIALRQHSEMRPLLDAIADMPGASRLAATLVSLPCHFHVRVGDVEQLTLALAAESAV